MWYLLLKAFLSGAIIAGASEAARRSPPLAAIILSLPLVSILAMLWLWHDTHDPQRLAGMVQATFWYILPTLPLFLVLPALLRNGVNFWMAIAASCLLTILLYGAMIRLLAKFGIGL